MILAKHLPTRLENLTPANLKYYKDLHRFIVVTAGRRSRKTLIGDRKILADPERGALNLPGYAYFLAAPTHQQAKAIFWNRLKRDTQLVRSKHSEVELKVWLHNGSTIQCVGLDKPERIEGQTDPPIKGIHITEMGNIKDTAWTEHIRPVLSDTDGFAIIDGVPEGLNHYYDMSLYAAGGSLAPTERMKGVFLENPDDPEWMWCSWYSSDVLPEKEIEAARRELDEKTFKQEYEGSFESYEGLAYTEFGNHNIDNTIEYNPAWPVSIGMDFNVDPMTATLGHIRGDQYLQFGEIYQNHSDTFTMRDAILDMFKGRDIEIFPDSTGKHESSNAKESDLAILRRARFNVHAHKRPPFIVDRVNAVNSFIKNRENIKYKINSVKCPKTINDLNKVERLADGRLNKDQEKQGLKHITDALGYLIEYNWPVQSRSVNITSRF